MSGGLANLCLIVGVRGVTGRKQCAQTFLGRTFADFLTAERNCCVSAASYKGENSGLLGAEPEAKMCRLDVQQGLQYLRALSHEYHVFGKCNYCSSAPSFAIAAPPAARAVATVWLRLLPHPFLTPKPPQSALVSMRVALMRSQRDPLPLTVVVVLLRAPKGYDGSVTSTVDGESSETELRVGGESCTTLASDNSAVRGSGAT